jgi:hypothetical protein
MAAVLSVTHAQTVQREDTPAGRGDLARFREEFYGSLTARADALFELTDAVLCADGCWPPLSMQMTAPFRMPMSGT